MSAIYSSNPDSLNRDGFLAGAIDAAQVGIFGHSRGGYIANIAAFRHDCIKAAASMDSFLWGYSSKGTGLERHPKEFRAKVRTTPKPICACAGRPAGGEPTAEAKFSSLECDGCDFVGDFTVLSFPGWSHGDFATTPWLCGRGESLVTRQQPVRPDTSKMLSEIVKAFFDAHLRGGSVDALGLAVCRYPAIGGAAGVPAALIVLRGGAFPVQAVAPPRRIL